MPLSLLTRSERASEGMPPWAGIGFVHPIDSDELAEDLKRTYPTGRTLRERKHMAIIDFFTEELRQMQQGRSVATVTTGRVALYSAVPPVLHHQVLDDRALRCQHSPSPAGSTCSAAAVSAESPGQHRSMVAVAPLEAVSGKQFVFSAADGKLMHSKTKRKMTLDEKTAYKETRRRGACPKCKRQKEKVSMAGVVSVWVR
jgi:hypothetical protein